MFLRGMRLEPPLEQGLQLSSYSKWSDLLVILCKGKREKGKGEKLSTLLHCSTFHFLTCSTKCYTHLPYILSNFPARKPFNRFRKTSFETA